MPGEIDDGCGLDFTERPTDDSEIDYELLFAGVPEHLIEQTAEEWRSLAASD